MTVVIVTSADCKRGRRKGATSKNVKNRQKVSKSFSTLFDNFRAGQKTSKIVKKCQKVFRHFSTIFARHLFSGPFCNPLITGGLHVNDVISVAQFLATRASGSIHVLRPNIIVASQRSKTNWFCNSFGTCGSEMPPVLLGIP